MTRGKLCITSEKHPKIADLVDKKSQLMYMIQVRDTMTEL